MSEEKEKERLRFAERELGKLLGGEKREKEQRSLLSVQLEAELQERVEKVRRERLSIVEMLEKQTKWSEKRVIKTSKRECGVLHW